MPPDAYPLIVPPLIVVSPLSSFLTTHFPPERLPPLIVSLAVCPFIGSGSLFAGLF